MKENEMDGARDAYGEEERNTYCIWRGSLVEIEHVKYIGIDGSGKLKCVVEKWNGVAWTRFIWLKMRTN